MNPENVFRSDDGNFVSFYWEAVPNGKRTRDEGRPVYDKALFCRVVCPGQSKSEMIHELERYDGDRLIKRNEDPCNRYARQIESFKAHDKGAELAGTPIEQLPGIDIRLAAELRALNVYTVEALAELGDTGLQKIGMGARELQARAKAYIEAAKGNAPILKLTAENEQLRAQVDELTARLNELAAKIEKPEKKKAA